MEKLKLYYSSEVEPAGCELDTIFSLLNKLNKAGVSLELINTSAIDKKKLHEIYVSEAVYPTFGKHYRIGHIFGTQKESGLFFGKEQPALLVFGEVAEKPTDIFPHTIKGQRLTIEAFLREKLSQLPRP